MVSTLAHIITLGRLKYKVSYSIHGSLAGSLTSFTCVVATTDTHSGSVFGLPFKETQTGMIGN